VKSLSDIIAFNSKHPDKVKYGQGLLQASDATPGEANSASVSALGLRTAMGGLIDGAMAKDNLDAILATGASYANVGASAGYPTVIVPAGLVNDKTATGISFMGTAWSEAKLLRIAAAYETGTHRRVPPTVVNSDLLTGC
jgi:amidase